MVVNVGNGTLSHQLRVYGACIVKRRSDDRFDGYGRISQDTDIPVTPVEELIMVNGAIGSR